MINFKNAIPTFPAVDIRKAVQFYEDKMRFKARHQEKEFAIVVRDDIEIHLWQACDKRWKFRLWWIFRPIVSGAESFLAGTASCRIEVRGIDELYQEYKASGVIYNSNTVIEEQPWGHRDFPVLDLYGNLITFFEVIS
ncbi:bleomycin resistance protein [Mucilaginibacter gossypiicola]|nr:VOC family protein [Mucilaginibacter gossypiicola]